MLTGFDGSSPNSDRGALNQNFREIEIIPTDIESVTLFCDFAEKVFPGANFRLWHSMGLWSPEFLPHSLFSTLDDRVLTGNAEDIDPDNSLNHGRPMVQPGRVVSNVSATLMDVLADGNPARAVQIGTVGTLREFRGRGLARRQMNLVLEKYEGLCDFFFLFANDSVVDFYPSFGFRRVVETVWVVRFAKASQNLESGSLRVLNPGTPADYSLLSSMVNLRIPSSKAFSSTGSPGIAMWHALNTFRNGGLVLFESEGASPMVFAVSPETGFVDILDVVSASPRDIGVPIRAIAGMFAASEARVHFPPDCFNYKFQEARPYPESLLFVRGRFPTTLKGFAFPGLGQT